MEKEELFKSKIEDKAKRAYNTGRYEFTAFLDMYEQDLLLSMKKELNYIPINLWGGKENAERKVAKFGNADFMGYDTDYPISCIKISPLQQKFADKLTHRDFLGSLMNLGIERDRLGDIVIQDNQAYLFCVSSISDFIAENLSRVRHTSVKCSICDYMEGDIQESSVSSLIRVTSPRLDGVVSKVYNLSRSVSNQTIISGKVFVNSRLIENPSYNLSEGDIVSVRGLGRFTVQSFSGVSKKGKQIINIIKQQ